MSLTIRPKSKDTFMVDMDDEPTMDLDENPPTKKPKAPTSFLDLPRELRQTIIEYSHDYQSQEVDIKNWYQAYKYVDWANALRKVHPVLEEDVDYLEKGWNKRLAIMPYGCIAKSGPNIVRDVNAITSAEAAEDERLEKVKKRIMELGMDPMIGSS